MAKNDVFLLKWLPLVLLALIIIVPSAIYLHHTSQLEQVPSCLYGCYETVAQTYLKDLINNPGNSWQSSGLNYADEVNIFPKTLAYLHLATYSVFKGVFNWDYYSSWKAVLFFQLFLFIGISILVFYCVRRLTKNDYWALIATLLINMLTLYPSWHFRTQGAVLSFVAICLTYFFITTYGEKEKFSFSTPFVLKFLGLALLHFALFTTYVFFPLAIGLWMISYLLVYNWNRIKKGKIKDILYDKKNILLVALVGFAGFAALMTPWWFKATLQSENLAHAVGLNDSINYSDRGIYFRYLAKFISSIFFAFSSLKAAVLTLSLWLGALILFFHKSFKPAKGFLDFSLLTKSYFIALLLASFHYLLTQPLLGRSFAPGKLMQYFYSVSFALLFIFVLYFLSQQKIVVNWRKQYKNLFHVLGIVVVILLLFMNVGAAKDKYTNNFYESAKNADSSLNYMVFKNLYYDHFEKNNINPADAILLSTNEVSTAANALLGTQLINGRYGFYYQYFDYQPYWFDAAVIFYSNNSDARYATLKKYADKMDYFYLYWDFYWINSEYNFDDKGNMQSYYNPIKFYDSSYARELQKHNISFWETRQSFEPNTYGLDRYAQFDLFILSPLNYRSAETPWNEDLDQYLEEVWSYDYQGQNIAKLFKITV